jgi:NifU-like protein involved in Fe-S cluster formation
MLCGRADCYIYSRCAHAKAQCAEPIYPAIMTTLSEIYNAKILELAAAIPHAARLAEPDATATAHSKLCGSTVSVDLKMDGDRVADYGQNVKACLLGQSAASVMGREIVGSTAAELRQIGAQMRRMLKEGGEPPTGRWADLAVLQPVKDYKARHASTLLVFDAVERALDEIEARKGRPASGAAATSRQAV